MSITITPENFKKYAKRQQKTLSQFLEEHSRAPSLNESQEILAKTLGFSNYHEYFQKVNQPAISIVQAFIDDLKNVINDKNSTIQKCYITKGYGTEQKYVIQIHISVNDDDFFSFKLPNNNIQNKDAIKKELATKGITAKDSENILNLFEKHFYNLEYEGFFFSLQAIKELDLDNRRGYMLKNIISEKKYSFNLNGQPFNRQYSIISDSEFKNVFADAKKQSAINMLSVEMDFIECFNGRHDLDEGFVLHKIINSLNVFVESYRYSGYFDCEKNDKFHFVQKVWFYDGKKLLKASGFDILKHL